MFREEGGTCIKAWPLERLERQKVLSVAGCRPCVCLCGCEYGGCAVRDQPGVDRDQAIQALGSSATFGDRPLPGCAGGGSHSQEQPAWRRVSLAGPGETPCSEGQAGPWRQTALSGKSWGWQVEDGRGRRKGMEVCALNCRQGPDTGVCACGTQEDNSGNGPSPLCGTAGGGRSRVAGL